MANLYIEEVERKFFKPVRSIRPSLRIKYMDDTWVKIQTHPNKVERFTQNNTFYLESHHPLEDKQGVNKNWDNRANSIPSKSEGKKKEHQLY